MVRSRDPLDLVGQYLVWEREFEPRQALRRGAPNPPEHSPLAPYSVVTGLVTALRDAIGPDRRAVGAVEPHFAFQVGLAGLSGASPVVDATILAGTHG